MSLQMLIFFLGAATCIVLALLVVYPFIVKLISLLPDDVTASRAFRLFGIGTIVGLVLLGFAWMLR